MGYLPLLRKVCVIFRIATPFVYNTATLQCSVSTLTFGQINSNCI
ncbi:hypothetical protein THF1C08_320006 [Vibrio jasicida]|nr:hypothetical protein THF1C08_320006 [Vibrio jasicida]